MTPDIRRCQMPIRNPVVSGQFYPSSETQLKKLIESFVDKKADKEEVIGLLAPHAGYIYSGPVVGAVLSRIIFKDTFIIMAPNHTGKGKPYAIMTEGSWKTPLGDVEIDTEFAKKLLANCHYLKEDSLAHEQEHAIEVQL